VSNSELFRRGIQMMVSVPLFDAPGLLQIRTWCYRRLFSIGRKFVLSNSVICLRPHNFQGGFLKIGQNVRIHHNVEIDYSGGILIEDDVWISQFVLIETHEHIIADKRVKKEQPVRLNKLIICRDAWIGAYAVILPGVQRIGEGSIVGAGAIVTKDVGDWEIVGGVPAKVIGRRGNDS
jgi:acetyltransferase-like isoleucine patch superfamily enzyme